MVMEGVHDWDLLLSFILFDVQELPKASTGFISLELLFRGWSQGLMNTAEKARDEQPSPYRSVVEYMQDIPNKINTSFQLCVNTYRQPRSNNKDYTACQHGLGNFSQEKAYCWCYIVVERIGPVNYQLQQPDKGTPKQTYHINLL